MFSRTPEKDVVEINNLLEQRIEAQDKIINDLRRDLAKLLKDYEVLLAAGARKQGESDED